MNKLDLLILAGAGAMIAAAGGLWFSKDQIAILRPMQPDASLPVFKPFDPAEHEKERRRIAVAVPGEDDDDITVTFHRAAKALRNSPCSDAAKAAYLQSMTAFARYSLQRNLAAARRGEEDRVPTPLQAQATEYFDMMPMYGYISGEELRDAMKGVSPGLGLMIAANERNGEIMPDMGGSACDRRRQGEPQPAMSWEPQPGDSRDRDLDRIRRRS
ncbi:MAG: hypothetical protein EON96_12625 [Caulobacteraceae bacterium]|nr:MAG: hypothetical protein EON96_12625 [Caulobacteraceae bacterium]